MPKERSKYINNCKIVYLTCFSFFCFPYNVPAPGTNGEPLLIIDRQRLLFFCRFGYPEKMLNFVGENAAASKNITATLPPLAARCGPAAHSLFLLSDHRRK